MKAPCPEARKSLLLYPLSDGFERGMILCGKNGFFMDNLNSENIATSAEGAASAENVKVSVIIPVYNAHEFLPKALETICAQDFTDFEIILVDDGSTDRSLDIIKEFKERDQRIRIITENNAGPAAARNKGLSRARGKYVIFLDADDFYEPTLLSSLYNMSEQAELDVAVADFDIYSTKHARFEHNVESDHFELLTEGRVISKSTYPDHILQCATGYVWNKMFRRDFLTENELSFNTSLKIFEDVHFVMTALATAGAIAKKCEVLVHHRIYKEQSRPKMFKQHYINVFSVYSELKKFLMHKGIYAPISSSFINLSANRCYKIYNILWKDAKENFWNLIHDEYADALGWKSASPEEIENPAVRSFIAAASLYTHKQFVKKKKTATFVADEGVEQKFKRKKALVHFIAMLRFGRGN